MCPVCKFRGWLQRCLKSNKPVGLKAMTDKKDRERVSAEITLSHLIRLGNEQGCPVSRQRALAFLNQEGRAFEMWKPRCKRPRSSSHAVCSSIPSVLKTRSDSP